MAILLKLLILICVPVLNVLGVSKKKGIVHMVEDWMCGDDKALDNIAWWYDYSPNRDYFTSRSQCSPFKTSKLYSDSFVPMAWGLSSKLVLHNNEKYCLAFNEPNHISQSDVTAQEAAEAWPELERRCKGAKLVSPSACICGEMCNDKPIHWFDTFFELCKDCRVDYIATHTFSCNANKVMKYLEDLYNRYGKLIWLTEFTCGQLDNIEIMKLFMKQILPRLEAAPYIFRFAWYKGRVITNHYVRKAASLLKQDKPELTELGKIYNDYDGGPIPLDDDEGDNDAGQQDDEDARLEIIIGVTKAEAMILAPAFTDYYTEWYKIFGAIEKQLDKLPQTVAGFYMSGPKAEVKNRIKTALQKIICTDPEEIDDNDISAEAERIRNLEPTAKKKQSLKRPGC